MYRQIYRVGILWVFEGGDDQWMYISTCVREDPNLRPSAAEVGRGESDGNSSWRNPPKTPQVTGVIQVHSPEPIKRVQWWQFLAWPLFFEVFFVTPTKQKRPTFSTESEDWFQNLHHLAQELETKQRVAKEGLSAFWKQRHICKGSVRQCFRRMSF